MAEKAILFDSSKCTACRGCMVACKQWWGLEGEKTQNFGSYENPPDLTYNTWVKIRFKEIESKRTGGVDWLFTRQSCMHCTDAACVKVCPSGALYHTELGTVAYNEDICTGCGYCLPCPQEVDIPHNFKLYNDGILYEKDRPERTRFWYSWMTKGGFEGEWFTKGPASQCVQCGECEIQCPQHIPISETMPIVHQVLGEGKSYDECLLPVELKR